ncbi:MAG: sugar phosphate isomerase/epimerase family protein [Acidimicrobiales bacterium]
MNTDRPGLERLAMNQATVPRWSAEEAIEGCAREGYVAVGLWRDRVSESSPAHLARTARTAGVQISSLCRGGWFCAGDKAGRRARMEDNFRAVEEAAALGAGTLVLVCGPAPSKDLKAGRLQVAEAIAELAEFAAPARVPLAIEPMHPLYCADRSVVVTLAQALRLAASVPAGRVGVMVDSYHLWWDPQLEAGLAAAGDLVLGLQLADWIAPPPDPLNGRGMLGDGTIDLRAFRASVDATGYAGPVEVEIFNPDVWAQEPTQILRLVAERYLEHVA